jgi:hypothetical protein
MTAVPLILYAAIIYRRHWKRTAALTCALIAGYVVAKFLFVATAHLLSIHFVQDTAKTTIPSLHTLLWGIAGALKGAAQLYSGGTDAGSLLRVCNALFTCVLIAAMAYAVWRKLLPRRLLLLVGCVLAVNMAVYVASGEANQSGTDRYLIMTAPVVLLLLSASRRVWQRFRVPGAAIVCVVVVVNGMLLGRAVVHGAQGHFSQDAHLASAERYVAQHPGVLPYSSMDTAIPASYLSGSDSKAPLPLSCSGATLLKDSLFYSRTAFRTRESKHYRMAAIILDGTDITNVPSACTVALITAQLGRPKATTTTDDGSTVLLYSTRISHALHY